MVILFIIALSITLLITFYHSLKNTVFGLNFKTGNYSGFFIFYQIVVFIIPSCLLLNIFPIENFWVAFKVKQESVFFISLLVFFSVLVFILSLKSISKVSKQYFSNIATSTPLRKINVVSFVRLILFFCFLLIAISWLIFHVGHSFTLSIITETSVGTIRLAQSDQLLVKITKHFFIFISPFLAAIAGSTIYKNAVIERVIVIIAVIFIASWAGNKSPLITIFIVLIISHTTFVSRKLAIKSIIKGAIILPLILLLTYKVVLFQYPLLIEFSLFIDYFYQRVFVAQMIGVYEQFNLLLFNPAYLWHGVPFASLFVDFPQFHKDLMLISEDRFDSSAIGIKNTLFIAEAYGMGGVILLLVSPIIMAINFSLTYVWMVFIINRMVIKNLEFTKKIVAISLFSYVSITGGFSDLMLFKITILITILIFPLLLFHYFILRRAN